MTAAAVGTFLRPVGVMRFAYCYRVDRVWPAVSNARWGAEPERWSCTRFGLSEDLDEPVPDHVVPGHSICNLVQVAPDVWRDVPDAAQTPWRGEPLYWRAMRPRGQQELFS